MAGGTKVSVEDQGAVYQAGEHEVDLVRRELRTRGVLVPLGSRAFDVVEKLVRSAGELVTKDELLRHTWPGVIAEEGTLQVHISAIRKALGPHRKMLKTEFGRGYRLLGNWTLRDAAGPAVPAGVLPPAEHAEPAGSNLPLRVESLVGRSVAVQQLRDLLSAYRVVTLTGPGGIGKSALALGVARELLAEFDDGVRFVEFASLSDRTLVPSAVAAVLGLSLAGEAISGEAVARGIARKNLLLVLDNCEHLIDALAQLAETVVRLCPRVTVISTSREALRIDGEYVYRVPPLDVPAPDRREPRDLLRHSAVELFVARVRASDAGFAPDGDSLLAIASICQHLDGIPLAIEFAASRAVTLGVNYVAKGLEDRFALLASGRRTALPRHQTLRAVLDWSYDLLTVAEQCLLRHLAVFTGGFTLEAVATVVRDVPLGAETFGETMANLVDKSLVSFDRSAEFGRWRLLETTRAYAYGKLAESGELAAAERRHAEYYSDLFGRARGDWERQPTSTWLAEYGYHLDDLRAILEWAFSARGDVALGINLTADAVPLWMQFSLMAECRRRVDQALSRIEGQTEDSDRLRMRLWTALALSRMYTGEPLEGISVAWNTALEFADRVGDPDYQRRGIWGLFASAFNSGAFHSSLEIADRFCRFAHAPADKLVGERLIGTALHFLGDQAGARQHIEAMLASYSAPVTSSHIIRFQNDQAIAARRVLVMVLWLQGYPDQAMTMVENAIAEALALDHALTLCNLLAQAGCPLALLAGDLAALRRFTGILIECAARHSLAVWIAYGWCFEGAIMIADGDIGGGMARLQQGGDALKGARFYQCYTPYLGLLAAAWAAAGDIAAGLAAIDEALARTESTGERWCLAELLRIKGELLRKTGDDAVAAVWFEKSLMNAREQGVRAWELRTALSLARLRIAQGRGNEARSLLTPVYERFTEGFEAAELRAAKALLDTMPPARLSCGPL
jgi:predicted ATPase/DNA-binding winged helix-turn-helix (wHTH) protein